MKIVIDTNIILDVLLDRNDFIDDAIKILSLAKRKDISLFITANTITDIYYIVRKQYKDKEKAISIIKQLIKFIRILDVNELDILNAIKLNWNDFEDSVLYSTCENKHIDFIVTRNKKDYETNSIKIFTPKELLEIFQ